MHQARPRLDQAGFLALGQVEGMTVDGTLAQQALGLVSVQIIARLRKQGLDPSDLIGLLGEVGLHQTIGIFAPQSPQGRQLFGGRGRRKPGADHISQTARAMPLL